MKRAPSVYTPTTLLAYLKTGPKTKTLHGWHPARPIGLFSVKSRICLAWEVFTGRADVLRWPHQ